VETNSILKVESGVDWITLTGERQNSWEVVLGMAQTLWEQQTKAGHKAFQSSRHGFAMSCIAGVQYGRSHSGWMIVLSGELANAYWMPFAAYAHNITRLDLQCTIWYAQDMGWTIKHLHTLAKRDGGKKTVKAMTLIDNGKKGDTLYYGSRTSAQFGRIYDKYREQKESPAFLNAVRYEVEYKKPLSGEVVRWLLKENPESERIASRVLSWFTDRGISVPEICTNRENAIQYPVEVTPIDKKIAWLRKTVRPVYRQLVALGFQIEADGSIGISDDAITVSPIEKE
jgi:replication initiation factor